MVAVCLAVRAEQAQAVLRDRDGAAWLCCLHLVTGELGINSTNQGLHKGRGLVNYLLLKLRLTKGVRA